MPSEHAARYISRPEFSQCPLLSVVHWGPACIHSSNTFRHSCTLRCLYHKVLLWHSDHERDGWRRDGQGESHIEVDPRLGDLAAVDVAEKAPIVLEEEPAAAYLRVHSEWADYEPSEAGAVLRKIDWRLMPLIIGTITIAAVDVWPSPSVKQQPVADHGRGGRADNAVENPHLQRRTIRHDDGHASVGSIFYFGWLIAEYPGSVVLQKFPVGKTVGAAVVVWGILVMCLGAAQNAAGLMALRFLMGVFEAPLFPSCHHPEYHVV
ncbi:uncharacterized protein B0I36DRAFT_354183 [Microdochium trichocladiopsis]|uniref:Major facilitator superfamily (MFS) profile domain-containing protein n=1 Tax=Microdochium trichocladiopsis TaxID=1682393 RepID=A0A9P9BLB5_9PEZI|nr:uncharacterized protein B0I36DRAFT_354183 [Microdochium trichocladiopsis]KAH7021537.1 hypothetical protein B0I36DRAFT_354183 [Microdochium trichocladiopsis]